LIPVKTVSEANTRGHWSQRAKRAKEQRQAAYLRCYMASMSAAGGGVHPRTLPYLFGRKRIVIDLTRVSPGTLDDDNLRSALKATRDGIADALGLDDRDKALTWTYQQRRGKKGQYEVHVVLQVMD
jgi:hypothetical protein